MPNFRLSDGFCRNLVRRPSRSPFVARLVSYMPLARNKLALCCRPSSSLHSLCLFFASLLAAIGSLHNASTHAALSCSHHGLLSDHSLVRAPTLRPPSSRNGFLDDALDNVKSGLAKMSQTATVQHVLVPSRTTALKLQRECRPSVLK